MSIHTKEHRDSEDQLSASAGANLPDWRHSKVFVGNFNKQSAMLELSRNRLRVLTAFLTGEYYLGNTCQG